MELDYSDGAEIEHQIESLLSEATDLQSSTAIGHAHYHRWPIRYHLCPERANLLRHLNFTNLNVLELGAGMGGISRFLAENSASLTVVEGTERRFSALSQRLRDLKNWKGQVANLMSVSFDTPFDVAVVVGALEYSELYVKEVFPGESPFDAFLRKAKSFLKPEGVLILAIENQLGLKYFNGSPEDHTDYLYDGISGYSTEKSPKTFSRKKLLRLFETAGFHTCYEYFPFPDYKLPTSVLTPALCLNEPSIATNLATHTQASVEPGNWNAVLTTQTVAEAGLLPELANSFLIVASSSSESAPLKKLLPPCDQLAWHYSLNRKTPTCTRFVREQGVLRVKKTELFGSFKSSLVAWSQSSPEAVKRGVPVRQSLLKSGHFEGYEAWLLAFNKFLQWSLAHYTISPGQLAPVALDALFTNAVQNEKTGEYELFDLEWIYHQTVPTSWFLLRNVLALYADTYSLPWLGKRETLASLYESICKRFQIEPELDHAIELEAKLQVEITPETSLESFVEALRARLNAPVKGMARRQSSQDQRQSRERLARISERFPDYWSCMDRPSTRFLLTLDQKIRSSRFLKAVFRWTKDMVRRAYRLLPSAYEIERIENKGETTEIIKFRKTFGSAPKIGWSLVQVKARNAQTKVSSLTLQLKVQGNTFTVDLPWIKGGTYRRLLRLHEQAQELGVLSETRNEVTVMSLTTRNLLKAEVAVRAFLSEWKKGFDWRDEKQRALSYWRQGRFRGLIAYINTLVQRSGVGIVESYSDWMKKYDHLSDTDRGLIQNHIQTFCLKPKISILMPVFNTDPKWLERAILSAQKQLYQNWELCIADDASTSPATLDVLKSYNGKDPRIRITFREKNGHISEASNTALEMAIGEFVAILDHDDELSETALYHVVRELNDSPNIRFLYSDEDKVDTLNRRFLPHFKTDWNPELFHCYNLITHFAVLQTDLVRSVGGFRRGFEGSQDYDLFLRCIENLSPEDIRHIPYILYHWRVLDSSTSGHIAAKPYAKETARKALSEHLERTKISGRITQGYNDCFRMTYSLPESLPKVSVIICTRDRADLLQTVIDGLRHHTDYPHLEVLVINNQTVDPKTLAYFNRLREERFVQIIDYDQEFNFAAMNNLGAKKATGEILAFLNNDLKITQDHWLKELVSFAIQPHVGAVGAKLLYPSGRLQHAGVILGIGGVAGHSHKGLGPHQNDFYARTHVSQCVSAVTAACLLVRRSLFEKVGGFDQKNLKVAFNDVDFCLALREFGYQNIWTPYAELIHFESESRGSDQTPETFPRFKREESYMKEKWGSLLQRDPYYNPNLTLQRENFDFAYPPRVGKPWKRPGQNTTPNSFPV